MSKPEYLKEDNLDFCLAHLNEECGEVVAAIGKTMRWGYDSVNPELPFEEQETNLDWVLRELSDVKAAIARFEALANHHPARRNVEEPHTQAPDPVKQFYLLLEKAERRRQVAFASTTQSEIDEHAQAAFIELTALAHQAKRIGVLPITFSVDRSAYSSILGEALYPELYDQEFSDQSAAIENAIDSECM